ncbi:hypothetical protein K438DRAFT_227717 [Mycena galopus ATCC 62051]|nr:hypothetical protein K438DRAFT_227717 [Mycena galopus ATCC 62051]
MPVNTRSSSIARSTSPAGSDSSDVYYEDPVFDDAVSATAVQTTAMPTNVGLTTAVPAPDIPAATADDAYDTDAYETSAYETDTTTSVDDRDSTPTPVQGRNTSPASVIEISAEEFPALAAPVPAAAAAPRRKAGKKNKDKGKKRAIPEHTDDEDPFLTAAIADSLELASSARFEADTATATADSLGLTNTASLTTAGASSSRRGPGSPPKRVRTDSAGNAVPASRQGSPRTTPTASRSPFLAPVSTASTTAAVYTDTTAARARATHVAAPAAAIATPAAVPATVPATATFAAVAAAAPIVLPNLAQAPAAAVQRIVAANPVAAPAHLWPTADRNPPRGSYTAIPLGFTPIIYSRTLLMQGMPLNLMQLYNEVPHPKFFITVSGGNGVVLQTHGLIRESISDAINIGAADFQLGTPPLRTTAPPPCSGLWPESRSTSPPRSSATPSCRLAASLSSPSPLICLSTTSSAHSLASHSPTASKGQQ